ncbi:MAG TPA: hypothetical protein DEQ47_04605 [Solibacterales bacterium]|nr:hypothetical protein [Bryobacterales bacterium]
MAPWKWLVFGLLLLVTELLNLGGFYLLFFGIGALLVGLAVFLLPDASLTLQIVSFLGVSVFSALFLRRPLLQKFQSLRPPRKIENITGETAVILEPIAPGSEGEAELRGTRWTARNIGDRPLEASERCTVDHIEGLMLCIRPK